MMRAKEGEPMSCHCISSEGDTIECGECSSRRLQASDGARGERARIVAALEVLCAEVCTMQLVPQGGPSEDKRIRDAIHYGTLRAVELVRKMGTT